jgi:hypothetical protein
VNPEQRDFYEQVLVHLERDIIARQDPETTAVIAAIHGPARAYGNKRLAERGYVYSPTGRGRSTPKRSDGQNTRSESGS